MAETSHSFAICVNRRLGIDKPSCAGRGSEAIADALEAGIRERGISVSLERMVCFGMCKDGPNARLIPGGVFHKEIKPEDVPALLDELAGICGERGENSTETMDSNSLAGVISAPGS